MSIGTVTLLCASLVLGQAPGDVFHTNQRSHRIPLNYEQARQADIQQVMLFYSIDQGKTWQLKSTVTPDQREFQFAATTDGQYWLQVASVNRQGKQDPPNITKDNVQQKMIIDTMKPLINITQAQRQGDEVAVAWEIQEDHPNLMTFKLEYQVQPSPQWIAAPVAASLNGKGKFRPGSTGPVALRLQLHDHAGNATMAAAEVKGTPAATIAQEMPTTPPAPMIPPVATQLSVPPAMPQAVPPTLTSNDALAAPPSAPEVPRETVRAMAPPPPVEKQLPPTMPTPPPINHAWAAAPGATPPRYDPNTKLVASSDHTPPPAPAAPIGPARKLPALQFVNSPEVTLEYELSKVGPSGVGSVDLWWTQNDGQTWEKYAFDPEAKTSGRHQRVVELPADGVYGFQLVVKSRAGLGRREPRAGDAPEIRIEVDTVSPIAQLFAPVPDAQRANSLILSWSAKDNNLTTHPITLEWAERREGPWQPIVANQPNTGKYSWQLPDTLPVQVHLRLRARDCAGNEGVAVTPEPQLVDLSEPEGRLLNVSVPPRR